MQKHEKALQRWWARASTNPSAFLLAMQLISLGLYAVFKGNFSGRVILGSFGILVLLLVVWVINHSPLIGWIVWVIVIPAFGLSVLSLIFINPQYLFWSSLLQAVLYFYATVSLISYMMGDYRVTSDELFAAGATFTLLAWGFAYSYQACQSWDPDSFLSSTSVDETRSFLELLSLSFTNLTATGLSDILPITPPARVLVMLEQFCGVGYVAVVVSRLIGMTLTQVEDKRSGRA